MATSNRLNPDSDALAGDLTPTDLTDLPGDDALGVAAKTKKKKCMPPNPDDEGGGGGGKKGNERSIKGPICDLKD